MNEQQVAALLEAESRYVRRKARLFYLPFIAIVIAVASLAVASAWQSDVPELVQAVPAKGTAPKPVQSGSLDLTWPAAKGATSYRVALFRRPGGIKVDEITEGTHLRVTLKPGTYQWVVWPRVSEEEQAAIVSAALTVK